MTTETLSQTIGAGGTVQFGSGTNFLILASSSAVNIVAIRLGSAASRIILNGALQGFQFQSEDGGGFDLLEVTSAAAQSVTFVVGDDDVSYPSTVNIAGNVNSQSVPASAVSNLAPVVTAVGQAALFPQNVLRRRITVFSDPANVGAVIFFRGSGLGNNLGFVTPGQSIEFDATYAIDYDATIANDKLYLLEEE